MPVDYPNTTPASLKRVFKTWWPLAASWLLMGLELPALSAVIARMAEPEINLAAYGGVVFPLALIIESPIIMLLAASTALSKDQASYRKIWAFMMTVSGVLTALHLIVAFTPAYYFVVEGILGAPQEIIEPARIGLMIMTPWTWSIAYRRFNQGVLIRFGYSGAVGIGTILRLSADILVLGIGFFLKSYSGVIVATSAVAAGVVTEAVYAGLRVRPILNRELRLASIVDPPLTLRAFLDFYIPLVLTSFLTMAIQPIGSAALGRMPRALESLAVWPVVTGLIFILRSVGMAYNEVVVAILDEPFSATSLHRFTRILAISTSGLLLIIAATPLATFWFTKVSALSPALTELARNGLWIAILLPGLNAIQSWYQGSILVSKRTRGIPEAVVIFLVTTSTILLAGVLWGKITGLYIGLAGFLGGMLTQTFWLWRRSRAAIRSTRERDDEWMKIHSWNAE